VTAELPKAIEDVLSRSPEPGRARALVDEALTHRTWANEHPRPDARDNQRLELLGDAVLGLAVSRVLFERLPDADEGLLSRARASVVNEGSLSTAARRLGIGPALRLGRGEEANGGRDRSRTLADALEALFGAAFLGSGMEAAEALVFAALESTIDDAVREAASGPAERRGVDARVKDAKSILQELVQRGGGDPPTYELESTEGPVHDRLFVVGVSVRGTSLGRGEGHSRREAEMRAATEALSTLRLDPSILEPEAAAPAAGTQEEKS
jgi:ribonuclease-3